MTTATPKIPNKSELQACLGETLKLDGSFASLWAIEVILNTLRKRPEWHQNCDWIPDYLLSLFTRAYTEMGLQPDTSEKGVIKISNYSQNVYEDYKKLLNPPTPFPTIDDHQWSKTPVFHLGTIPWYGMAVIFQAQQWAGGNKTPLDQRPELRDRSIDWLVKEYLRSEFKDNGDEEFKHVAEQLLRAILWPTILHKENHFGELNLPTFQRVYESESMPDNFMNVLLRLLVSQDKLISVFGGAACFLINIAPSSALEARCIKRCIQYFKTLPPALNGETHERVLEVIDLLSSSHETPLKGMKEVAYLESIRLANEKKYDLASERLTTLILNHPDRALYVRTRGKLMEKLDKDQYAIDDYNVAIRLKPDYWQALINRGTFYARKKKFKQAYSDFLAALKLRPDCENTRDNLLSVYFLNKAT